MTKNKDDKFPKPAQKNYGPNTNFGGPGKPIKGFGGKSVVRRTGRGR